MKAAKYRTTRNLGNSDKRLEGPQQKAEAQKFKKAKTNMSGLQIFRQQKFSICFRSKKKNLLMFLSTFDVMENIIIFIPMLYT